MIHSVTFRDVEKPIMRYPKIMQDSGGLFVLFSSYGEGTVIGIAIGRSFRYGEYSSTWDMDDFEDLSVDATVILQNTLI